ncbi:MAG: hypothetical protein LBQ81_08700 [Zoogloeaceae bacterium]|nr:hypothetical protein [Zoogloeaceae bacterium]
MISISERKQVLDWIATVQPTARPFAQACLTRISEAMSDTACTGLCAY